MEERPIFLTSKRLLYNIARVDFEYGRVTQEFVNQRKLEWETEYKSDEYFEKYIKTKNE